jgi:hypothetical protein
MELNHKLFLEFWDKPKILVGLLPVFITRETKGVIVGEYNFKPWAEEVVERNVRMDAGDLNTPLKCLAVGESSVFRDCNFKYYDTIEDIPEETLTGIKAKCGFIKMFDSKDVESERAVRAADKDKILPMMAIDKLWENFNALHYVRSNDILRSTEWFFFDKD